MNNIIKPQGSIFDGRYVYLTTVGTDGSYYVLTSVPNTADPMQQPTLVFQKIFLNDAVNNDINPAVLAQIVTFQVVQKGDAVQLPINSTISMGVTTTNVATVVTGTEEFYFVQTMFQGLATPTVLMSGVMYNVLNSNNQAVLFNIVGSNMPTVIRVIPIPVTYYTSGSQLSNDPKMLFSLNYSSYISRPWMMGYDTMGAWTTSREATTGRIYAYCLAGVFCSNNCVSYCSSSCCDDVAGPCSCSCIFNESTQMFECRRLTESSTTTVYVDNPIAPVTPSSSSSYKWLIIFFIIAIIIIVILFIVWSRRGRKPQTTYHRHERYTTTDRALVS